MKREKVKSSNVFSIGYDETKKILEVEFNGGGIYQYTPIPKHTYAKLMKAESKGVFLSKFIKNNKKFKFTKIEEVKKQK